MDKCNNFDKLIFWHLHQCRIDTSQTKLIQQDKGEDI